MAKPIILINPDKTSVDRVAAQHFIELAKNSIEARGRFIVALCGGSSPKGMYEILSQPKYTEMVDWDKVYVFWSDERLVPYDNVESNYGIAKKIFLDQIPIPQANIHPVQTNLTPAESATSYSAEITKLFNHEVPKFDVIFLGMGQDGHTASLFPKLNPEQGSTNLITIVNNAPKPPKDRISFSFELINNAYIKIFLVTGLDKAETLKKVLNEKTLPASKIDGNVIWILDEQSASQLEF